ncbi:ABC transporter ATP-binding protein [Candidatus Heimdallarchaeota archaeon B3_Heim]|nr:MAG: ABC transporter ATP-binding protein [Candidatus Heimdallarchaeota archaeon B3_Heim]
MNYDIKLQNVSKYYAMGNSKVKALENLSLEIDHGEIVVFLGPSGSGKTTLLNLVGALENATNGMITIGNKEITQIKRQKQFTYRRETIGFIFQTFNLFPTLSALENVQYVADLAKLKRSKQKAIEALQIVGLGERIRHFPHQLSGGEQQRVAIARALVKDAPIILADEPTGELDFKTGRQILSLLVEQKQTKKTVLLVTHNREISRLAHRVIELQSGQIVADGPPKDGTVSIDNLEW